MSKPQGDAASYLGEASTVATGEMRLPYGVSPISAGALICLRIAGWVVAIFGVLAGAITLAHTPEGFTVADARFRGIYLAIGWALLIGGIAGGILLNVVAGIGSAVLDMWRTWYSRA
jgi:hypothetical protein